MVGVPALPALLFLQRSVPAVNEDGTLCAAVIIRCKYPANGIALTSWCECNVIGGHKPKYSLDF